MKRIFKKVTIAVVCAITALTINTVNVKAEETVPVDPTVLALIQQQQAQAAVLLQYQKALADQYEKALFVQQAFAKQQAQAVQQAYLLNSVQAMQKAQYESMIKSNNYEYQNELLSEFIKNQQGGKDAFLGYEGLKK